MTALPGSASTLYLPLIKLQAQGEVEKKTEESVSFPIIGLAVCAVDMSGGRNESTWNRDYVKCIH